MGAVGAVSSETAAALFARLDEFFHGNPLRTLDVSATASGLSPEGLLRRISQQAALVQLLAAAMQAAQSTALDAKLVALGRCLAVAVTDASRIDEEQLLVSAIAAVEAPHLRLLRMFGTGPRALGLFTLESEEEPAAVYNEGQIGMVDPAILPSLRPLVAVLLAHGLIVDLRAGSFFGQGASAATTWEITDHGRLLLSRAELAVAKQPSRDHVDEDGPHS